MNPTIRAATRDDLDALVSLRPTVHDRHVAAHPEYFKPMTSEAARREAESWLQQENAYILLAEIDGRAVGYAFLYVAARPERDSVRARRVLYLDQITVAESCRGRGYGKALLDGVRGLARRLGIDIIELDVWSFNDRARRFFLDQGFASLRQRLAQRLT